MERFRKLTDNQKLFLALGMILIVFCSVLLAIRTVSDGRQKEPVLSKKKITLTAGEKKTLKIKQRPSGARVVWKSTKKSVASVSKKGRVTAKKKGKAKIQCRITYRERGKKKTRTLTCRVTVKKKTNSQASTGKKAMVYMTKDISPAGLMAVYKALHWTPQGKVAVKVSTGEPPASNYLKPALIKELVQSVDGTIVECNTAYGGSRASTALHRQVAKDHGFTDIAKVDIMDADGSMTLPVKGGSVLKENYVGSHFKNYDSFLVLSHFKGHSMAGFGGAIKNISIGIGSSKGKSWIHSGGTSQNDPWGGEQNAFLKAMGDAGKAVSDSLNYGKNIVYVNVMNRLSVDCDCDGNPAEPKMADVGILASTDPVALDQACVDLIYEKKNGEGAALVKRIESRNGLLTLENAEKIGLGSRNYQLEKIDK